MRRHPPRSRRYLICPPQSSSFGRGCDADSKRYSIAESCTSLCDHLIPALQKDTGKTSESLHISLIFNKHERKYRHMEGTTTLAAFTRDRICCQKSKKSLSDGGRKMNDTGHARNNTLLPVFPMSNQRNVIFGIFMKGRPKTRNESNGSDSSPRSIRQH